MWGPRHVCSPASFWLTWWCSGPGRSPVSCHARLRSVSATRPRRRYALKFKVLGVSLARALLFFLHLLFGDSPQLLVARCASREGHQTFPFEVSVLPFRLSGGDEE